MSQLPLKKRPHNNASNGGAGSSSSNSPSASQSPIDVCTSSTPPLALNDPLRSNIDSISPMSPDVGGVSEILSPMSPDVGGASGIHNASEESYYGFHHNVQR